MVCCFTVPDENTKYHVTHKTFYHRLLICHTFKVITHTIQQLRVSSRIRMEQIVFCKNIFSEKIICVYFT